MFSIIFSQDKYIRLPVDIESKLLPFQREGVRYEVFESSVSCQCVMLLYVEVFNLLCAIFLSSLQIVIFRFILQHGGRALLADEMGLGKTLQANDS